MRWLWLSLAVLLLAGCSVSISTESEPQATVERTSTVEELVPGYTGGCVEGFAIYAQNQFEPYGSMIRRALDEEGVSVGLRGNEELQAVGWVKTDNVFYPDNPEGLRGEIWFYVPELPNDQGPGWLPDAGVRATKTEPAPGNGDEYFDPETQASPQLPECELIAR